MAKPATVHLLSVRWSDSGEWSDSGGGRKFRSGARGRLEGDAGVQAVVSSAISSGRLPKDTNGIYFVITSSDVNETSGFCTQYCGWHTHGTISGADIKYSFIGNPDRCLSACAWQTRSRKTCPS